MERKERMEACQKLCVLEALYIDEMTDHIVEFVRPLRSAILSPSDNSVLFQNLEKVNTVYHVYLYSAYLSAFWYSLH